MGEQIVVRTDWIENENKYAGWYVQINNVKNEWSDNFTREHDKEIARITSHGNFGIRIKLLEKQIAYTLHASNLIIYKYNPLEYNTTLDDYVKERF
jgi:hypothetical protein